MDKSSGDQNTGTEMLAEEEDLGWDVHPLDLLRYYRETTSSDTGRENDDCWGKWTACRLNELVLTDGGNVKRKVILGTIFSTSALRLFHVGHLCSSD